MLLYLGASRMRLFEIKQSRKVLPSGTRQVGLMRVLVVVELLLLLADEVNVVVLSRLLLVYGLGLGRSVALVSVRLVVS